MRTHYDLTLTIKQMDELQNWIENDRSKSQPYFDPIYLCVMKAWYRLLGVEEANTKDISDPKFIKDKLAEHAHERTKYAEVYLCTGDDPVDFINKGIDQICELYGFYSGVNASSKVSKEYWICDECQNFNEPNTDHCIYCGAERT